MSDWLANVKPLYDANGKSTSDRTNAVNYNDIILSAPKAKSIVLDDKAYNQMTAEYNAMVAKSESH